MNFVAHPKCYIWAILATCKKKKNCELKNCYKKKFCWNSSSICNSDNMHLFQRQVLTSYSISFAKMIKKNEGILNLKEKWHKCL